MKIQYSLIPILLLFLFSTIDSLAQEAEVMPVFGKCDVAEYRTSCSNLNLLNFISDHLEYPEIAKAEFIEGTVVLGLTIDANGAVTNTEIIRDIGGGCGLEGLRLLDLMPNWIPGKIGDQAVAVKLTLPIRFALGNERPQSDNTYRILWGTLSNREEVTPEMLRANLLSEISVLDEKGNKISKNELLFSITKKKRYQDASSTGEITSDMIKLVSKVKPGVIFAVIATIQLKDGFEFVEREFQVIKKRK